MHFYQKERPKETSVAVIQVFTRCSLVEQNHTTNHPQASVHWVVYLLLTACKPLAFWLALFRRYVGLSAHLEDGKDEQIAEGGAIHTKLEGVVTDQEEVLMPAVTSPRAEF